MPPDESAVQLAIAPVVEWEWIHQQAYPIGGADVGPTAFSALGVPRCFAHSSIGALLAASTAVLGCVHPETNAESLEYWVLDEASRQELMFGEEQQDNPAMELVGFRFLSYKPDEAVIHVAVKGPTMFGMTTMNVPVVLVWEQNRWWWDYPASGEASLLSSIADYVSFKA